MSGSTVAELLLCLFGITVCSAYRHRLSVTWPTALTLRRRQHWCQCGFPLYISTTDH